MGGITDPNRRQKKFRDISLKTLCDDNKVHQKTSTLLVTRKMQIKITMKHHYTFIRMTKVKLVLIMTRMWWGGEISHPLLVRMWNGTATLEKITQHFLKTLNTELPYDPAIALLGIYPREMKTYICKSLYMNIYHNFSHCNPKVEIVQGFLVGSVAKESSCNAEDLGSIPGLGRSYGGGHGNLLQYSCLENLWTEELGRLQSIGSQSRTWLSN